MLKLKMSQQARIVKNVAVKWFIKWAAMASLWLVQISQNVVIQRQYSKKSALLVQNVKKDKLLSANLKNAEFSMDVINIQIVTSYPGINQFQENVQNVMNN